MSGRVAGKFAVVVGAGQTPGETIGNGHAIAELFAREGAEVLCVDRLGERAQETAAMIAKEGGSAYAQQADVTKAADCAGVVAAALERWGRLDILINNVGIGGGDGPAHRVEEAAFDRIIAVNLKGMWLMTKAALGQMREQGSGAIVNISSLAAVAGGIQVAYEVSKAGVNRLTTSVAASNARHGIRCNAILPGLIDTPMPRRQMMAAFADGGGLDDMLRIRAATSPTGKQGEPWDVAYAALYLASDEAKYVNGTEIVVDGGLTASVGWPRPS